MNQVRRVLAFTDFSPAAGVCGRPCNSALQGHRCGA